MPRIGELLIAEGILSEGAVRSALGFQRHTGEPFRLGTILLDRDLLAEESLLKALSAIHRFDYHGDPEKTASVFNDRGWNTIGDVGRLDEQGYLYLTGSRT